MIIVKILAFLVKLCENKKRAVCPLIPFYIFQAAVVMAVKSELEGLIHNHNLLISRGSVVEAAKVKDLIAGYMSQKDMMPRLYRAIRDKFEEFIYCAETNFERFKEIINYEHLTQLEFLYPSYFNELPAEINKSAEKMIAAHSSLYAGLLISSSIHADKKILAGVVESFLERRKFDEIERIFDRLEETRLMKMQLVTEDSLVKDFPLISDDDAAERIGKAFYGLYSIEADKLENLQSDYSAGSAYRIGNILTSYFDTQELIKDAEMTSTATLYLKEIVARTNSDNIEKLISFLQRFRKNPAIKRYGEANPEIFGSYINSPDVRDGLVELVRNLLGKTRFDEVDKLSTALKGMIGFQPTFRDHLATLKENGFFVQAIDMAEKLQLRGEITDELKLEAFVKLMDELTKNPIKGAVGRLKKFSSKQGINSESYPQITAMVTNNIQGIEKINPELVFDLESLYRLLKIERKQDGGLDFNPAKLFEPIIWFFGLLFRGFIKLAGIIGGVLSSSRKSSSAARTR